ncbi:MAG: M81 family metallopeptidase [Rhodospirillaceae bacterium]|nr:M81 family metallopeptidase [Rhodospirillaceae bacterium]
MKWVLATVRHETNTFSPLPTELCDFSRGTGIDAPLYGDAARAAIEGTNTPINGFLDVAKKAKAEIVVPIYGNAAPSGKVTDAAFDHMTEVICNAVGEGCDAVFLDLHGAMVSDSHDDAEGELLARVRAVQPDVPIAVALDFHTNPSDRMLDNMTTVAVYRTYPHIDMRETGTRAGQVMWRALKGEINPVIHWGRKPMLTHMLKQTPSMQPMKDIMNRAIQAEADGEVALASVLGGFPLADIPHVGVSAFVVTDGNDPAGPALVDELLGMAWDRRADFVYEIEPMAASIAHAKTLTEKPVVLADHGDNTGAGGNVDVMAALEEVMRQGLTNVVAGTFWDPITVAQMIDAGIGAEVTLQLGGRTDMPALNLKGKPLEVSGRVSAITDGVFTITGPMNTGSRADLGRTAVLDTGDIEIFVSEKRFEPIDAGMFAHAGIDPTQKDFVLVKSRQHFRAGFEDWAAHIVMVAGPGVCSSDYSLFPFKNLARPIYPLDEM